MQCSVGKSGDIEKGLRAALCAVGSEFQVVAKKREIIGVEKLSEDQNRRNASQSENKCRDERGEMENKKQKTKKQMERWKGRNKWNE